MKYSSHEELMKKLESKPIAEVRVCKEGVEKEVKVKILNPREFTRDEAILHILACNRNLKHLLHWQMTSRAVLVSLYLQDNITDEIYDFIDQIIADGVLINLDWKLDAPAVEN